MSEQEETSDDFKPSKRALKKSLKSNKRVSAKNPHLSIVDFLKDELKKEPKPKPPVPDFFKKRSDK